MGSWELRAPAWQLFLRSAVVFGAAYAVAHALKGDWTVTEGSVLGVAVALVHGTFDYQSVVSRRRQLQEAAGSKWSAEEVAEAWRAVRRYQLPATPTLHEPARRLAVLHAERLHDAVVGESIVAGIGLAFGVLIGILPDAVEGRRPWGWFLAAGCLAWLLVDLPRLRRNRERAHQLASGEL